MNDGRIKSVFIATPQWLPLNPPFSLVPVVSYLKENGFESKILDFNIEYYIHILNKEYLNTSLKRAYDEMPALFNFLGKNFKKGKKQSEYSDDFKSKLLKYNKIKEFKTERADEIKKVIDGVDDSIRVLRDKELFYQPMKLVKALNDIDLCLEVASLPYFPAMIQFGNYSDPFFKLDFKCMLKAAESDNMFTRFLEGKIPEIIALNPDLIGISINSTTQIISALTLGYILKKKTKAKISIGGNFFSRVTDTLAEYPDFFRYFCDYVTVDEGEISSVELCRYLSCEIEIDKVSNLIYLKDNKVKINSVTKPLAMNLMPVSNLDDFDLSKYFTPDIVLPQQSSKGCYWGKCSFCDHDFGQKLSLKPVGRFVDELEIINKKYGIKHFELIDECISPNYLNNMSKKILEKGLDISWFNNARLEKGFNFDVLKTAQKAGLKMLLWGFESGSKKIMEYINKGIDIENREEILTNSRKAGIWNFAFIFFGFPSETKEDAIETIEYIKNHTDIISSYGRSVFTLGKHTTLRENPEKFSITKIYKDIEEFSPSYHFETSVGMDEKDINLMAEFCLKECNQAYKNPLWMYLKYREILFLYISKFGADTVEKMRLK